MVFVSCVFHAFASVHCCLVVTCWERADLLALVGDVYCICVTFPRGILGQYRFLILAVFLILLPLREKFISVDLESYYIEYTAYILSPSSETLLCLSLGQGTIKFLADIMFMIPRRISRFSMAIIQ